MSAAEAAGTITMLSMTATPITSKNRFMFTPYIEFINLKKSPVP
jgi:hypothetical protein